MNDAISRSAALKMMDKYIDMAADTDEIHHAMCVVAEGLKELPALNVAPVVHARWIYSGYVDADGNRHANCSHCGAGEEHKEEWTDKVPYCWNCGARMDGKADATNMCR